MGTLHCKVVFLCCGNVAGTSFSQRCENNLLTTLYNVVFTLGVCWVVTNYGEGGATKREGGHVKFYPYEKGGGGRIIPDHSSSIHTTSKYFMVLNGNTLKKHCKLLSSITLRINNISAKLSKP